MCMFVKDRGYLQKASSLNVLNKNEHTIKVIILYTTQFLGYVSGDGYKNWYYSPWVSGLGPPLERNRNVASVRQRSRSSVSPVNLVELSRIA